MFKNYQEKFCIYHEKNEQWIHFSLKKFGFALASLFNGISTFQGYLMLKPSF